MSAESTRIVLVRHCESTGQSAAAQLTQTGSAQAVQLAEQLSSLGIDHIVSSPYERARATIEPFAARSGLTVHFDERLAERRLSPQPIDRWREVVARSFVDSDFGIAGGETGGETLARGWAAVESVIKGNHSCPVVVSHGQLLGLVLHSLDSGFGYSGWLALRNPDVYLLERKIDGGFTFRRA